jgi:2-desacetyl-2-hydroxyethyl bacteriochlorophyllide A dehydrogenase
MKAAVLYEPGNLVMEDWDIPVIADNEVLIKVENCGVCGTDMSLYKGDYLGVMPLILGHEFSGAIVEVGKNVQSLKKGDRVAADPNVICHGCYFCNSGDEHLCRNRSSMGVERAGADAEYCVLPEENVYVLEDSLSYRDAAFTEPLACAIHGIDIAQIKAGDTVLVIGAGSMGNLLMQLANKSGAAKLIVSEPNKLKRKVAIDNGAHYVLNPFECDIRQELKKIDPRGADVVIEAAGISSEQEKALSYVRPGGRILYFGCSPAGKTIQVDPLFINEEEISILGSFNNKFGTPRAIEFLNRKIIRVDNLITHTLSLDEYTRFVELFGTEEVIKIMVEV